MSDEIQDTPVENVFIYQDSAGEYRWKAVARNGEKIATSGEGYKNVAHAREMASRIFPETSLRAGDDETLGGAMQFRVSDKHGVKSVPVQEYDEVLIEIEGKGSMAPTVDIDTDGDKTIVKWTYSNFEGGVQEALVRIQPSSELE